MNDIKVIYTQNRFLLWGYAAFSWGLFIAVRTDADRKDILIAHESIHIMQFRASWGLSAFRYFLSRSWRLEYEAEAYAVSVQAGRAIEECASDLAGLYRLGIGYEQAKREIEDRL